MSLIEGSWAFRALTSAQERMASLRPGTKIGQPQPPDFEGLSSGA